MFHLVIHYLLLIRVVGEGSNISNSAFSLNTKFDRITFAARCLPKSVKTDASDVCGRGYWSPYILQAHFYFIKDMDDVERVAQVNLIWRTPQSCWQTQICKSGFVTCQVAPSVMSFTIYCIWVTVSVVSPSLCLTTLVCTLDLFILFLIQIRKNILKLVVAQKATISFSPV